MRHSAPINSPPAKKAEAKGLGDNENTMPGDELLDLALLISSFVHLLNGPMDLVPPVIGKLRALELVPGRCCGPWLVP